MSMVMGQAGGQTGGQAGGQARERASGAPLSMDSPWRWLALGWRDMWAVPGISLTYGLVFFGVSAAIVAGLAVLSWSAVALAMAAGFMLVGPMLAVGLYEASRRLEAGEPLHLRDIFFVATKSPSQLALLGGALMLVLLIWMRLATLLFALFFGGEGFPPLSNFLQTLFFTSHGLGLMVMGTAVGAVLAAFVFAISAISVPMLMERDMDAVSAMGESALAVLRHPKELLLWAWLIAVIMAAGLATLLVGMIIAFPLIGHATWHAYRDITAQKN